MPELPEVETVVRDLRRKVLGAVIVDSWFDWPKLIKHPSAPASRLVHDTAPKQFNDFVSRERIVDVQRRAKNILIYLSHQKTLLVHLKMTGHLLIGKWRLKGKRVIPLEPREVVVDPYNQYIHFILRFADGRMLALSDLRKFAKVVAGTKAEIEDLPELSRLGPDALDKKLTLAQFASRVSVKKIRQFSAKAQPEKRIIKKVLLDQEVISGIGNIYSDDILWSARIHPFTLAHKIKPQAMRRLYKAMREILTKAVHLRGTSMSDFRDTAGRQGGYMGYRLVYQREGEPCFRCGVAIERVKAGGRSAHYCPKCQVR